MSFNWISDLVVPVLVGGGATTTVGLFFKSYIEKGVEHKFNIKLEEYKAELGKKGTGYQIELSEFAKKKFEYVIQLYTKVLELQTRHLNLIEKLGENFRTVEEVTKNFDANLAFLRSLEDLNRLTSLVVDKTVTQAVREFSNLNFHIFLLAAEVYKYSVAQKFEDQRQFNDYTNETNERHKTECQAVIKKYDGLLEKVRIELGAVLKIE
ncbi:hypothetical protein [Mucilaginibacter ginsenosidivorax]|uniref:Uncharacterized protein n=1 Tax=Mucilaginibacter ginsenosidivorax TaxID=862126 RepID=A0A5B8W6S6_9SPHI|nr:hypothetical protein [Mucilaginibacter ginsenosidivorax]QEC79710.1 hypothetical protein FSB76_28540 [Mucilaginibacter ginsenosidivorax]